MKLKEGYIFGLVGRRGKRIHIFYKVFIKVSLCFGKRGGTRASLYIYNSKINKKHDNLVCKNCLRKYNILIEEGKLCN